MQFLKIESTVHGYVDMADKALPPKWTGFSFSEELLNCCLLLTLSHALLENPTIDAYKMAFSHNFVTEELFVIYLVFCLLV
jgi:hypothetical protein